MVSRVSQNSGIAPVEITLDNLTTTVAASLSRPITQADIDAGRTAFNIAANNQAAISTTTHAFRGVAVAVSTDVTSKGAPKKVTCLVGGVMTAYGTTTLPTFTSFISARGGKVAAISGTTARGTLGAKRLAQILSVWDTDKIDVVL